MLLDTILRTGQGEFGEASFSKQGLYDVATGREVASSNVTESSNVTASPASATAEPKVTSHQQLRTISWELGNHSSREADATSGTKVGVGVGSVAATEGPNYEIIIPWVLKNMIKRATDMGTLDGRTGIDVLTKLVHESDDGRTGILVLPELKILLVKLGIRVTADVLKELCRHYHGNSDKVFNKFKRMKEDHEAELLRQAQAKTDEDASRNPGTKRTDKAGDSDRDGYDSGLRETKGSRSAKAATAEFDDDDVEYGRNDDSKSHKESSTASRDYRLKLYSKRVEKAKDQMTFDEEDGEFGVDVAMLLKEIGSGRGLRSIETLPKMTPVTQSIVEEKGPDSALKKSKMMIQSIDFALSSVYGELPSACSVGSIKRLRREVLNICDNFGRTSLLVASAMGNCDLVSHLLRVGADLSITTSDGFNAITVARNASVRNIIDPHLVRWLSSPKITPSSRNSTEPADEAARTGQEHQSQIFNELTTEIESIRQNHWGYCRSPLAWAVSSGLVSSVKHALCNTASDPNVRDVEGRTPLHDCMALAQTCNDLGTLDAAASIAELLIAHGADVGAVSVSGRNCLHELFCANQDAKPSHTKLSNSSVGGMHQPSTYHRPVIKRDVAALGKRRSLLLRNLLQLGCDPLAWDRKGMAPIHYCAKANEKECIIEILRGGYDGGFATSTGNTPLHLAALAGAGDVSNILSRWDADGAYGHTIVSTRNKKGDLPIQLFPPTQSSECLDNLWSACRVGNLKRYSDLTDDGETGRSLRLCGFLKLYSFHQNRVTNKF